MFVVADPVGASSDDSSMLEIFSLSVSFWPALLGELSFVFMSCFARYLFHFANEDICIRKNEQVL